jgi:hypothetical protein
MKTKSYQDGINGTMYPARKDFNEDHLWNTVSKKATDRKNMREGSLARFKKTACGI